MSFASPRSPQQAAELFWILSEVHAPGESGTLTARATARFSWMVELTEADREACAAAMVAAAQTVIATGQLDILGSEFSSWRGTAESISDGMGAQPVTWLRRRTATP